MKVCIAGQSNIAIDICNYILHTYPYVEVYAITNTNDIGINSIQRSFKSYIDSNTQIKCVQLEDVYDIEDLLFLSLEFDKLIKPNLFKTQRLFNIHFSKLPAYKGMYTAALPILFGEKQSGVTLHCIDSGIDTGDIIDQVTYDISAIDTAESIYLKNIVLGTKLVINNLESLFNGDFKSYPQNSVGSSYYSKCAIDYTNLKINLNCTAAQLDNQIRAYNFRRYQLPIVLGYSIVYTLILTMRSCKKPGSVLEDTDSYIKLSTIDYDIILYKDKMPELIKACEKNDIKAIEKVENLDYFINIREKDHGWTMLMVASYNNSYEVVKYLLEKNSDVNIVNYNGTTPLMFAKDATINNNDFRVLDLLLEANADIKTKDYSGKDILEYTKNQSDIVYNYLKSRL